MSPGKYTPELLIPMLRKAATLRNDMIRAGFTDNGGAIHSASRILDILGQRLTYPGLGHINKLRHYPNAEFTEEAWKAQRAETSVMIEHVAPLRALTVSVIEMIDRGVSDAKLKSFIKDNYRLVLLTPDETSDLNRRNRSRVSSDRMKHLTIKTRAGWQKD